MSAPLDDSELVKELLALTIASHQGVATPEEHARLEQLLADNPEAIQWYLLIVKDAVALRDLAVMCQSGPALREATADALPSVAAAIESDTNTRSFLRRVPYWRLAVAAMACSLLVWLGAQWFRSGSMNDDAPRGEFVLGDWARITGMTNVSWADDATRYAEWSLIRPGATLKFESGRISLFIANGAELLIQGPADLDFVSLDKVSARQGKFAARVGPEATGFQIVTPQASVIDRGTSFGLSVDRTSGTSVAVYEGIVDLDVLGQGGESLRRLNRGEALSVDRRGHLSRIISVESTDFPEAPKMAFDGGQHDRIIDSVSDNMRSLETTKYYRVIPQGFRDDCQAYVDRLHEWNGLDKRGLPQFLVGGDYVMTFNDDKIDRQIEIAVTLNRPANLYVLLDDRVSPPEWLKRDFVDTNWKVGSDDGYDDPVLMERGKLVQVGPGMSVDFVFSVWRRVVREPSTVVLGPMPDGTKPLDKKAGRSMYGIVATPLPGGKESQ